MAYEWAELVPPQAFFPFKSSSLSLTSFTKRSKSHGHPAVIAKATRSPTEIHGQLLEDKIHSPFPSAKMDKRKSERSRTWPVTDD